MIKDSVFYRKQNHKLTMELLYKLILATKRLILINFCNIIKLLEKITTYR